MILPHRPKTMNFAAALARWNAPSRFTSRTARHVSSSMPAAGASRFTDAQLTRMSSDPSRSNISWQTLSTRPASRTSMRTDRMRRQSRKSAHYFRRRVRMLVVSKVDRDFRSGESAADGVSDAAAPARDQ